MVQKKRKTQQAQEVEWFRPYVYDTYERQLIHAEHFLSHHRLWEDRSSVLPMRGRRRFHACCPEPIDESLPPDPEYGWELSSVGRLPDQLKLPDKPRCVHLFRLTCEECRHEFWVTGSPRSTKYCDLCRPVVRRRRARRCNLIQREIKALRRIRMRHMRRLS